MSSLEMFWNWRKLLNKLEDVLGHKITGLHGIVIVLSWMRSSEEG